MLAAQLLGIGTGRLIIGAFALCGVIAALTGVITASQLGSGQPALGASYLLPAYAAVFLGATTVKPGQFNVWGTVVAAYLLGAGVAGLQQLGIANVRAGLLQRRCARDRGRRVRARSRAAAPAEPARASACG